MKPRFFPHCVFRRGLAPIPLGLFVLALAFQIAMPFQHSFAERFSGDGAETIVLCTGTGLKTVILNSDGTVSELPEPTPVSSACEYCQICPFGANGALALAAVQFTPYARHGETQGSYQNAGDRLCDQVSHLLPATRGPPA